MCNVLNYLRDGDCERECPFFNNDYACKMASCWDDDQAERGLKRMTITGRMFFSHKCSMDEAIEDSISKDLEYYQVKNEIMIDYGYELSENEFKVLQRIWHISMDKFIEMENHPNRDIFCLLGDNNE